MDSERGDPSTPAGGSAAPARAAGTGLRGWTMAALLAPAVGVVCILVARGATRPMDPMTGGKGGVQLRVIGPRGPVRNGATLFPGEVLHFVAHTPHPGYALVLGLDQRGQLTPYCPPGAAASMPLTQGGEVTLPGSASVDGHAGMVRYYLLFTQRPASVRDVEDAIRAGHTTIRDPLPIAGVQASVWVEQGAVRAAPPGGSVDPTPAGR